MMAVSSERTSDNRQLPLPGNAGPGHSIRRLTYILLAFAAVVLALAATSLPVAPAQGAATGRYAVKVTKFTLVPAKPKAGQRTKIFMEITTTGAGKRSIPWEILVDKRRVARGTARNVPGKRRIKVSAKWTAKTGRHNFLGRVDPKNTLKESSKGRRDNGRGFSILISAAVGKIPPKKPRLGKLPTGAFTVQLTGLTISPREPQAGQNVTLKLKARAAGRGKKSVPWQIKVGNRVIKQGSKTNVAGGRNFEVSVIWKAKIGNHKIEGSLNPGNKLGEAKLALRDNRLVRTVSVAAAPDWAAWGDAAWDGTKQAVALWQVQAKIRNIMINGDRALCVARCLQGPSLKTMIKTMMRADMAPNNVARDWADAVDEAWKRWQEGIGIPGLLWYPSFLAVASTHAPPTRNIPAPLSTVRNSNARELSAARIKNRLRQKLDPTRSQPSVEAAINTFADRFARAAQIWLHVTEIRGVMGSGRVPTYKPPLVLVGPVIGGTVLPTPGILKSRSPFGRGIQ